MQCADALAWMAACADGASSSSFSTRPSMPACSEALAAAARVAVPDGLVYLEADREWGR